MTGRRESAIHSFTLPDDQRGLRETTKPGLGNPSDPAVPEPDRSSAGNADSLCPCGSAAQVRKPYVQCRKGMRICASNGPRIRY